eukprot:jgi/Tetstr1/464394/TSEL_009187.t1
MDDDVFWADEENEEQVGPGGWLANRVVRGNNESTEDSDQKEEDEDEECGNEDEGDEDDEGEGDDENNGGYLDVTFHGAGRNRKHAEFAVPTSILVPV